MKQTDQLAILKDNSSKAAPDNNLRTTMIGTTLLTNDHIPEMGTPEFKAWWESQYAPAESHHIADRYLLSELEWRSFESGADFTGK